MIERLDPVLRYYDWGSATAIPAFLDRPATGEPVAEAWYGAHPSGPSPIHLGAAGETLAAAIERDPEAVLGVAVVERFGPTLPYLVKVLAADKPLSIQAHPSAAQAAAGFAREDAAGIDVAAPERTYRDPYAKPETIVALERFELLYGLRDPRESASLLDRLGVPSLADLADRLRAGDDAALRDVATSLCERSETERATAVAELAAACAGWDEPEHAAICRWIAPLGREHPADLGVLFAVLMNHVELQPLEACFLPAQTLHAYLRGTGIEVMGNSDNVVRAGLTSKPVAARELLDIVVFATAHPAVLPAPPAGAADWHYPVSTGAFDLHLLTPDLAPLDLSVDGPEILVALDGKLTLRSDTADLDALARGDVLFLSADTESVELTGEGRLVRVTVGTD